MKKVTKEWLWLMSAAVGSLLCTVVLIAGGVRPRESLPMGIYAILLPIGLVYFVRLTVWAVRAVMKRVGRK
jgi:hypothetical protein